MAAKLLTTIAIPTYNEERDIKKCLDSIYNQEIRDRTEVLIVDDNSTDNTLKIVKEYSKKMNVRVIKNGTKNAERGKKIGLDNAKGEFFMYLDADMEFADKNWLKVCLKPLLENRKIIGTIARFGVKKSHNALSRCISYDIFQRDPIFIAFTPSMQSTIISKKEGYYLCRYELNKVPCQSLCLYRKKIIKKVFKNNYMLMDNDIQVILVKKGYNLFAFCPQVKIYHFLLRNLKELFKKRLRGVTKTYMNNLPKREYKWFNFSKKRNILLMGLWIISANIFIPSVIYGLYKSIKYRDVACMYEPLINIVSTDSLIYGFFKSKKGVGSLFKL